MPVRERIKMKAFVEKKPSLVTEKELESVKDFLDEDNTLNLEKIHNWAIVSNLDCTEVGISLLTGRTFLFKDYRTA